MTWPERGELEELEAGKKKKTTTTTSSVSMAHP